MLIGNAGLGKTHAALAIAGRVLEQGFDVVYVSSPDFFARLEALLPGADPAGEEETLLRTASAADLPTWTIWAQSSTPIFSSPPCTAC